MKVVTDLSGNGRLASSPVGTRVAVSSLQPNKPKTNSGLTSVDRPKRRLEPRCPCVIRWLSVQSR